MCGILGIASNHSVTARLLDGLSKLEYRGYDSSGIAVLNEGICCNKVTGTIQKLWQEVNQSLIDGNIGIGHTRWATHGRPNVVNAHPHIIGEVAVVHNGIIENANELRTLLKNNYGVVNYTDTDTEVIPQLIEVYLNQGFKPLEAFWEVTKILKGSFTFAALFKKDNSIIAVKKGSPLIMGCSENNDIIISSDIHVLSLFTKRVLYLEDREIVHIKHNHYVVYDRNLSCVKRTMSIYNIQNTYSDKGSYPYFMLKEIYEQPQVIENTARSFLRNDKIKKSDITLLKSGITIVACGSSYFAALIAKYWLESIAKIVVQLEIASEFTHFNRISAGGMLFISQSGETADILSALNYAKSQNNYTISLTNTKDSSLARLSDTALYTEAGIEVGVASTKTFSTQLVALQYLAISIADKSNINLHNYTENIALLVHHMSNFLTHDSTLHKAVEILSKAQNVIYIGRGTSYGLAMEGALKLKELSYIPTEGIAAGELKHGTLALIDEDVVVVAIIPYNHLFYKTLSNIQEVVARKGRVIAITNEKGTKYLSNICDLVIKMPIIDDFYMPLLYTLPMQLIAYYTALQQGHNIDQPRNLAKSVTVE